MTILTTAQAHLGDIVTGLTYLITFASFVANFTHTTVDNVIIDKIAKIVNVLALNIKSPNVKKIEQTETQG